MIPSGSTSRGQHLRDAAHRPLGALASLAGSWWQIANPPPALADLYAADPRLASACIDLAPRLRRTAAVLLAGLVPSRETAGEARDQPVSGG